MAAKKTSTKTKTVEVAETKAAHSTKKSRYYSIKSLKDTGARLLMAMSQRGIGKTYSALVDVLEEYRDHKWQFVYLRRWQDDISTPNANSLFMPIPVEDIFGPGYSIEYYQRTFNLVDPDGNKEPVGFLMCLSESHHKKSTNYPYVQTIVFDEFIQMAGEPILPGEMTRFQNTVSTIFRDRANTKIYMLANTVSRFSPYFVYAGIDINKLEQGQIMIVNRKTAKGFTRVAVEWVEYNEEIGKDSSDFIFDNTMITRGEWEIAPVQEIPVVLDEMVSEKLVFSAYDSTNNFNMGCFLRTSTWSSLESVMGIYVEKPHKRQFLVLRETNKKHSCYHLTDQKSLDYSCWTDIQALFKDIYENTDINIMNELKMNRVFCDNMFTADNFYHIYLKFTGYGIRDML